MRNWIGTILTAVVAAVLALVAVPSPEAVGVEPPARLPAYAYDSVHAPAAVTSDAFDRGPPVRTSAASTYNAVDRWSRGVSARSDGPPPGATTTNTIPAQFVHVTRALTTTGRHVVVADGDFSARPVTSVAANGGERLLWTSWQNYPEVTQGGREYAQIGDRLYSHHAVDRLQPSGLGAPAGAAGAGRSISPNFVEDVLGSTEGVPVKGPNGEARLSFTSGTVQVITENNIVITVITR